MCIHGTVIKHYDQNIHVHEGDYVYNVCFKHRLNSDCCIPRPIPSFCQKALVGERAWGHEKL